MRPTRRDFLRLGLGGSTLLACGASVPTFLARSASALANGRGAGRGRVLVVLQLDGGNDGLNTVVPHRDDVYRRSRPRLALAPATLLRLNDDLGLHPALAGLMRLHEGRKLAVVQGVGYPNPNRSHFESMAIWHTARPASSRATPGWLARALDRRPAGQLGDAPALHVGEGLLPQALHGGAQHVPSLTGPEQLRRRVVAPEAIAAEQREALDRVAARQRGDNGSLLQFVQRSAVVSYATSARLESVLGRPTAGTGYPEFYGLARRLRLVAQLIKAGMGASIYYTQLGGFDTHAAQLNTHAGLLREAGDSVSAFFGDLGRAGEADRVLLLAFSEFGRRLPENGSEGTDHGTAGPVILAGPGVRPGVHGPNPDLRDLDETGDPRHAIDFRRVYATVLDRWLGCPAGPVLGARHEPIPIL